MLRNWSLALLLMLAGTFVSAQLTYSGGHQTKDGIFKGYIYGNEWYDPGKVYVKFRVPSTGIYRVTASELTNAGVPVSTIDADNFHLIFRGFEVPIHVDKTGSTLDSLEFFGEENDGMLDSTMYRDPGLNGKHSNDMAPNTRHSLYTDTSSYWLTWDNTPGLRYSNNNQTNYGSFTAEPYFRYESYYKYGWNLYNSGGGSQYDIFNALNSDFVMGEGYVGSRFYNPGYWIENVPTPSFANSGNPSTWTARIYGRSSWTHDIEVLIDGNVVLRDTNMGIHIETFSGSYNPDPGTVATFNFFAHGTDNNNTDNNHVTLLAFEYDRNFDMGGANNIIMHRWSKATDAYFSFANADGNNEGWIWDLSTHTRNEGNMNSGNLDVIVGGDPDPRRMYVVTDKGIKSPIIVPNHNLANLSDTSNGEDFIIITHPSLLTSAQAYHDYRENNNYNQMSAKVVTVDQIYDEFGYGNITPVAIKNFVKYVLDNWGNAPKYIFLWGKGKYTTRNTSGNLVPTWGYPACDYEYVGNWVPSQVNVVPDIPIGRVNVRNNDEGQDYLDKVIDYESTPWEPWMKQAIFLGGGEDTLEQKPIFHYLATPKSSYPDAYRKVIEGAPVGGQGHYFQKWNTSLLTNSNQSVTEHISAGLGLIHFFGHSSANIYDVDIQAPYNYSNWGRYPMIIAFGCYGGDFTIVNQSFGERFVIEKGRGSIGYLANSTAGFLSPLGDFGKFLYPHAYGDMYGLSFGDCIKQTMADYMGVWTDQLHRNHCKQLNLQGDPAIQLYHPEAPDLEITTESVFFEPSNFSASDDSFMVNVVVTNNGLVSQDSFFLRIDQFSPGGNVNYTPQKYPPFLFRDTLQFKIYNTIGTSMAGINYFDVFVDSDSTITEYDETNNRVYHQELIPGNVPAILYPLKYAVIDTVDVQLMAASYVLDQKQKVNYIFEIDTVPEFNSPMFRSSGIVVAPSYLATWDVPFQMTDSTVYYWRVRLANILPPEYATSSFKYIPNREGWAQSRDPQFFEDPAIDMELEQTTRDWTFTNREWELHVFTAVMARPEFRLNNGVFSSSNVAAPSGVFFTAFSRRTLEPYQLGVPTSGAFGDWAWLLTPNNTQAIISAIAATKHGDWFLLVSNGNPQIENWGPEVFAALKQIGCTDILQTSSAGTSFIILGQKGIPNSAIEITKPNVIDPNSGQPILDLLTDLESKHERGEIWSTSIGPASNWDELIWDWRTLDGTEAERLSVDVYGVSADGQTETLLFNMLERGTYDLTTVDPAQYPRLKLVADAVDSIYLTAPQMKHWHVIYDKVPDATIDPVTNFAFLNDTVPEGESATVRLHLRNLTDIDFTDSMLVRYSVERLDRSVVNLGDRRYRVLKADSAYDIDFTFSTAFLGLEGPVIFRVEVNPDYDQPEQYHFNNFYRYPFHVEPDFLNPVLDVTFDGRHIMDGDIVSPDTEIRIKLTDENAFLPVSDTGFVVHFGQGSGTFNLNRIFIDGNPQMTKVTSAGGENTTELVYRPGMLNDGEYKLTVQGYDWRGNAAGKSDFEITFQVINESTVSHLLNYPNPFSTSTRFVYTLTGGDVPDVFEIHIYTISGKLVKVIDLVELDEVKIGYTMTDYAWDGTDEFGDLLANGVYVYKVVTKFNGKELERRDEGISDFFNKNDFGKMYIMR